MTPIVAGFLFALLQTWPADGVSLEPPSPSATAQTASSRAASGDVLLEHHRNFVPASPYRASSGVPASFLPSIAASTAPATG